MHYNNVTDSVRLSQRVGFSAIVTSTYIHIINLNFYKLTQPSVQNHTNTCNRSKPPLCSKFPGFDGSLGKGR